MWINGRVLGETDSMVKMVTDDGLEIEVPADAFVEDVQLDLAEMERVTQRSVANTVRLRHNRGEEESLVGSSAVVVMGSPTQAPMIRAMVGDSVSSAELFGCSTVLVVDGAVDLDPVMGSIDSNTQRFNDACAVMRSIAGGRDTSVRGHCVYSHIRDGKFNIDFLGHERTRILSQPINPMESLSEAAMVRLGFTLTEIEQVSAILAAIHQDLLAEGPDELVARDRSVLGVDPDNLRILFGYRSLVEEDRVMHVPLSLAEETNCRNSLVVELHARLVRWIVDRISGERTAGPSPITVVHLMTPWRGESGEKSGFEEFVSNYLCERIAESGRSLTNTHLTLYRGEKTPAHTEPPRSNVYTAKPMGLLPLLTSCRDETATRFVAKLTACHHGSSVVKRSGPATFVIHHSFMGSVDYSAASFVERSSLSCTRDISMCMAESELPLVRQLFNDPIEEPPGVRNRRNRFSTSGGRFENEGTKPWYASHVSDADKMVAYLTKADRVKWIFHLAPDCVAAPVGIVELVKHVQECNGRDSRMTESEFSKRYALVDRVEPECVANGFVWTSLDEERRTNKYLSNLRTTARRIVQRVTQRFAAQRPLCAKRRAAIRIQRWIRPHLASVPPLTKPRPPSAKPALDSRSGLYAELLQLKQENDALKLQLAGQDANCMSTRLENDQSMRIAKLEAEKADLVADLRRARAQTASVMAELDTVSISLEARNHLISELTNSLVRNSRCCSPSVDVELGVAADASALLEEVCRARIERDKLEVVNKYLQQQLGWSQLHAIPKSVAEEVAVRDDIILLLSYLVTCAKEGRTRELDQGTLTLDALLAAASPGA